VNRHQDRLNMGWAIGDAHARRGHGADREMGANVVRLSHYEHAEHFHDLADRAGIVLWAEIPLVNRITEFDRVHQQRRQQMTELIRQNYNHPRAVLGHRQRAARDEHRTNTCCRR
jgi:beta-galactosidase